MQTGVKKALVGLQQETNSKNMVGSFLYPIRCNE